MVGLTFNPPAKFVRRYADAGALIAEAIETFRRDVVEGNYPADAESYHLPKDTGAALEAIQQRKRVMSK